MNDTERVAPAVRSILEDARERGETEQVGVEARSLPAAFERAEREGRVPLIAEVKPTSPTTAGEHHEDPVELAEAMVEGGAAAVSVLTEPEHFGGTPDTLRHVREAVDVPVLRKDFLLSESHLDVVAADLVLLVARFVDPHPGGTRRGALGRCRHRRRKQPRPDTTRCRPRDLRVRRTGRARRRDAAR